MIHRSDDSAEGMRNEDSRAESEVKLFVATKNLVRAGKCRLGKGRKLLVAFAQGRTGGFAAHCSAVCKQFRHRTPERIPQTRVLQQETLDIALREWMRQQKRRLN